MTDRDPVHLVLTPQQLGQLDLLGEHLDRRMELVTGRPPAFKASYQLSLAYALDVAVRDVEESEKRLRDIADGVPY